VKPIFKWLNLSNNLKLVKAMGRMWATTGRETIGGEGLGLLLPLCRFPGGFPFSELNPEGDVSGV
jgi:hypothetical protein